MPSCGTVKILHVPGGPNVRFDSALYQNYVVPPYYDSMLGKMIVCSKNRIDAIRKMRSVLSELVIHGVVNNSDMHLELISNKKFVDGTYTTDFLK